MSYSCHKDGRCLVDRVNRNRCQACRFSKCVDQGMSRETVRSDRGPRKRRASNDDELEVTRSAVQCTDDVSKAFLEVIGQVKKAIEINVVPDILQKTSLVELTSLLTKFLQAMSMLENMSPADQDLLVRFGIRAFIVSFFNFKF